MTVDDDLIPETDSPAPGRTPEKPKRSTARRITFLVGIGLILAGLGLLGYVAWQLWGTNWVSKRHQREITTNLQEDWAAGEGCDTYCPHGKASALIRIPKFGQKYVVPVIEGTSQDILARGYGHFEDTAAAGQVGNYALAAHRVTHGEPLRRMPELRPGDKVIVETRKFTYTYVLDTDPNKLVIPFTGTWVLDAIPRNPDGGPQPKQVKGQKLITLTTCSEIFHTDNRMIAFGHLVDTVRKTKLAPVNP
ncbi:class E sortase [Nocardioides marmoriginsengisoli]|uniref:class E sortase n=1 Tax=Nocardioides marmoriginsengisoli TaxID=661483 RepID=UPI001FE7800C|nr:class E sortase [Nocardioides marmoriginsengisoli]